MRSVSASIEINSAVEPIWRLMSEPERYPEFVTATHRLLDASDAMVRAGSTYREYGGVPPFIGESDWEVIEFEPMTHQRHVGDDGKMRMHLDIDCESIDAQASRLTLRLGLEPRWFLALPNAILWPLMMRRRAQKVLDDTVANTKRIVEAESG